MKKYIALMLIFVQIIIMTGTVFAIETDSNNTDESVAASRIDVAPFAISPPISLSPWAETTISYDGTQNFSYSPYFFYNGTFYASALTNFRIEFYDTNGSYMYHRDAEKYGNYYSVEVSGTETVNSPTGYYYTIFVNMHGTGTVVNGSDVLYVTYPSKPPVLAPSNPFNANADGTSHHVTSNFYFGNGYFVSAADTNYRIEFYDTNGNYMYHRDAVKVGDRYVLGEISVESPTGYYYINFVNMHGIGTSVKGSFVHFSW